jgi:tetratricopeptide (TPR) repeat protein
MTIPAAPIRTAVLLVALAGPSLAQSPPEAETRFSTGVMHLREGRVDLALQEFKRAVKEDPKNPYFQKGLGLAYAAKASEERRKRPPAAAGAPSKEETAAWKDAIECFRKALELNPYYVDVRNDLAAALIGSGDREAGKKEFLAAFAEPTNPTPEMSAYNLGQAYLEEKNYADAVSWYRTSLNRNKGYPDPYLGIAEALVATGRLDEAVAQLEVGVKEIPDDANLLRSLGQAYFKAGRFGEARERLEEAMRKDPAGPAGRAAAEQLKALPR